MRNVLHSPYCTVHALVLLEMQTNRVVNLKHSSGALQHTFDDDVGNSIGTGYDIVTADAFKIEKC